MALISCAVNEYANRQVFSLDVAHISQVMRKHVWVYQKVRLKLHVQPLNNTKNNKGAQANFCVSYPNHAILSYVGKSVLNDKLGSRTELQYI